MRLVLNIYVDIFYRFLILFDTLQVYCNEERTRTFLGLCIKSGRDTLVNIVDALNKGLTEFNLPTFYNVSKLVFYL